MSSGGHLKRLVELLAIQLVPFLAGLLILPGISASIESVVLFSLAVWLFNGAALVVATHPDFGVCLALFGPTFGLLVFFPFLVPIEDHNPLALTWFVWLVVSAVLIQTRSIWSSLLWRGADHRTKRWGSAVIRIEVIGSAALLIGYLVIMFGVGKFLSPLSAILAVLLPAVAWILLPRTRASLYESEGVVESDAERTGDRCRPVEVRSSMVPAVASTGFFFVAGLFLPMIFAVVPGFESEYVIGGILFLVAGALRSIKISS